MKLFAKTNKNDANDAHAIVEAASGAINAFCSNQASCTAKYSITTSGKESFRVIVISGVWLIRKKLMFSNFKNSCNSTV